jgi:hypothetical protein
MLILWRTILFAALWLVFESVISWAAFCQHQNEYGGANQTTEGYECVFRGPVASVARWFARWWVHTFDKADSYIALFTFVLAVGTLALWWSTRRLWEVTRVAADHVKFSERAHIYGGWGGELIDYSSLDGPWIFANLNNLGKTPAFIMRIAVAIRGRDDLPEEPYYPPGITPGFVLGENEKKFPVHAAHAWWGWRKGCVFYGRIWFTDVFDRKIQRYSSFILDIDSGYTAVMDRPRYWDIGEEKALPRARAASACRSQIRSPALRLTPSR